MTCFGAENETRTRDPNLGKVMLYQLSYFRNFLRKFRFFWAAPRQCKRAFIALSLRQNSAFFSFGIAKVRIKFKLPNFFRKIFKKY